MDSQDNLDERSNDKSFDMWNVKQLSGFRVSNENNNFVPNSAYRDKSEVQQYHSNNRE